MERQIIIKIILSLTVIVTSITFESLRRPGCDIAAPSNNTCEYIAPPSNSNNTLQNVIGGDILQKAIEAMRSKGYASMAFLLETRPLVMDPHERETKFHILAPSDKILAPVKSQLSPILLRHIVKLSSSMKELGFGRTFMPGFVITRTFIHEFADGPSPVQLLYMDDERTLQVYGLPQNIFPPIMEKDLN